MNLYVYPKVKGRTQNIGSGIVAGYLQQNDRSVQVRSVVEEPRHVQPISTLLITFRVSLLVWLLVCTIVVRDAPCRSANSQFDTQSLFRIELRMRQVYPVVVIATAAAALRSQAVVVLLATDLHDEVGTYHRRRYRYLNPGAQLYLHCEVWGSGLKALRTHCRVE